MRGDIRKRLGGNLRKLWEELPRPGELLRFIDNPDYEGRINYLNETIDRLVKGRNALFEDIGKAKEEMGYYRQRAADAEYSNVHYQRQAAEYERKIAEYERKIAEYETRAKTAESQISKYQKQAGDAQVQAKEYQTELVVRGLMLESTEKDLRTANKYIDTILVRLMEETEAKRGSVLELEGRVSEALATVAELKHQLGRAVYIFGPDYSSKDVLGHLASDFVGAFSKYNLTNLARHLDWVIGSRFKGRGKLQEADADYLVAEVQKAVVASDANKANQLYAKLKESLSKLVVI